MFTLSQKLSFYGVGSLRGLAKRQGDGKATSISLRQELSRTNARLFTCGEELNAGDVAAPEMTMLLQSDGGYLFRGHVFDHGDLRGDDFTVTATVLGAPGTALAASYSGNVGHQTNSSWSVYGQDDNLRDNFDAAVKGGVAWHLEQSSSLTVADVIGTIAQIGGLIAGGYALLMLGSGNAHTEGGYDDEGRPYVRVVPNDRNR